MNIVIFCFLVFLLVLVVSFVVKLTLNSDEINNPPYEVYVKIFFNHFQILTVIGEIDFKWPSLIQQILKQQKFVTDSPVRVFSITCLTNDFRPDHSYRMNYIQIVTFALLPVLVYTISSIFWAIYGRCKRIQTLDRGDRAIATSTVIIFLFYPTIVFTLAKSMNCI